MRAAIFFCSWPWPPDPSWTVGGRYIWFHVFDIMWLQICIRWIYSQIKVSYIILERVLLLPSLVTNFASPKGIEIKTKWLSQAACRRHKLCNFCARLNHFLGVYGKMKTAIVFIFPCSSSWCTLFFSVDAFFMEKIAKQNRLFSAFFQKSQNMSHGNGSSTFVFLIFETLSQRFLQNIFRNFQFFEKIKKKRQICCQNSQFSPWKMLWQKKQSTPRWRAWKNK